MNKSLVMAAIVAAIALAACGKKSVGITTGRLGRKARTRQLRKRRAGLQRSIGPEW